jgi:hypothetical protein
LSKELWDERLIPGMSLSRSIKDTRKKERRAMTKHMTGTREEWLAARLELLKAEKEVSFE